MPSYVSGLAAPEVEARLLESLRELQKAESRALLWFCEIRDRRLYRDLGYSSIWQFALVRLGFSRTRTAYFLRLAKSFQGLPALKQSVAAGEVTWTQAREVVKVATPRTEKAWIQRARSSSRRELERQVARTRARARAGRSHQEELPIAGGLAAPEVVEASVAVTLRFSPEQFARWEAALAVLLAGGESADREALALQAAEIAAEFTRVNSGKLICSNRLKDRDVPTSSPGPGTVGAIGPEDARIAKETARSAGQGSAVGVRGREAIVSRAAIAVQSASGRARIQVFVRRCPACEGSAVVTSRGDLGLGETTFERLLCDARVRLPGGRNTTRIPDRVRRAVLERDGYRCRAPGCGRTRFVEVHHRALQGRGGGHDPRNLITLCSGCHDVFHERERRERRAANPSPEGRPAA